MKKIIDLSVIIINYNTAKLTSECIVSVLANTKDVSLEIILVDNASDDLDKLNELVKRNKNIRLIKNSKNRGFASANNQGIRESRGRYILFLNSDTYMSSPILRPILDWMDNHPKVGISSCQLLNSDKTKQSAGGYFPTLSKVFTWMFMIDDIPLLGNKLNSFHIKSYGRLNSKLDWVSGAFFLTRRKLIEQIKGFDEDYFMYVEDVDFCYKARKLGWKTRLLPQYSIIHYGGSSSNTDYPLISEFKNIQLFYIKHFPTWQLSVLKFFFRCGSVIRILVLGIIKGRKWASYYAKAFTQIS